MKDSKIEKNSFSQDSINESCELENNLPLKHQNIEVIKKEVSYLSYNESIDALDAILEKLQNGNVSVEDLELYYLRANLYLEHCENILKSIKQDVSILPIEKLEFDED